MMAGSTLTVAAAVPGQRARYLIAIDPARDTRRLQHQNRDRFGTSPTTIRVGQAGDLHLAIVASQIAQSGTHRSRVPLDPRRNQILLTGPVTGGGVGVGVGEAVFGWCWRRASC